MQIPIEHVYIVKGETGAVHSALTKREAKKMLSRIDSMLWYVRKRLRYSEDRYRMYESLLHLIDMRKTIVEKYGLEGHQSIDP